jgi:purine catabolism regulator
MAVIAAEHEVSAEAGITVAEALGLPCLAHARVLAGEAGLDRRIRGVNVLEDADIVRWMSGGELLLTTGYTIREDPTALAELVPALAERGLAGLVVKVGLYVEGITPATELEANRLAFPVIGLPSNVRFNDILSEVLGTILNRHAVELERSNAIHARLTKVALDGGSFRALAHAVAELVQRPVMIRDAHGQALAATDDVPEDPDEVGHVVRPIKVGETHHGEIVLWNGDSEVHAHELKTMEHAATIAATAIAQERAVVSSEQRHRTLLLMQLISRRPVDRPELARWASAMGWDMEVPRAVVLVELAKEDEPVRVAGQAIEARLTRAAQDATAPGTIVWGLRSGLALLVEPGESLAAVCRNLHGIFNRINPEASVMIAAGGVAEDVDQLSRSYEEAAATLTLGRELHGRDFVLEHDELGVYRLLSRMSTEDLRHHRDKMIGALLEYDRSHNGALVQTLEAFLRCEGNRVRAAEELFVHYNTLRYRLTQVEKLTGALGGDPTARLNLQLALSAHRVLQGRESA